MRPKQYDMFGKSHLLPVKVQCALLSCGKTFETMRVREENYCTPSHRTIAWRERAALRNADPAYEPGECNDPRCSGAEGKECRCQCGGANHGRGSRND